MKFLLAALFLSTSALANLHLAPPDFDWRGSKAIFVDFREAHYEITYDFSLEKAVVKSRITFEAKQIGNPIFDLVPRARKAKINGMPVQIHSAVDPHGSRIKIADAIVTPGINTLEMENTLKRNVSFRDRSVASAFWIRDLKDRKFMEQYFPSNYEFDQYQITMDIKFEGLKKVSQDIYANGVVTETSPNSYRIEYPAYFTSSCPYFHTTAKGEMRRFDFNYTSISGRAIPMTIYSPWYLRTSKFKKYAVEVMAELENDYGPWAHPSFIAYGTLPGTGGMEHAGATQTSLAALDHEMLHSYFAKGVMPANGNSGWIDEAIAAWRDWGYPRNLEPGFAGSDIGGQSEYKRNTDSRSYALGSAFMGYLDYRLQDMGGLKAFLKGYFQAYKYTMITTEHFRNNLEFFSGLDLSSEFDTYVLGKGANTEVEVKPSHHHRPLTKAQLESLL